MLRVHVVHLRRSDRPASGALALEDRLGDGLVVAAHDAYRDAVRRQGDAVLLLRLVRVVFEDHAVEDAVELREVRLDVRYGPVGVDCIALDHAIQQLAVRLCDAARDARGGVRHAIPARYHGYDLRHRARSDLDSSVLDGRKGRLDGAGVRDRHATANAVPELMALSILHDRPVWDHRPRRPVQVQTTTVGSETCRVRP